MATYEYVCKKCKSYFCVSGTFETLFGLIPQCPNCKSKQTKKIISLPNVIYKGKGFYRTDKNNK